MFWFSEKECLYFDICNPAIKQRIIFHRDAEKDIICGQFESNHDQLQRFQLALSTCIINKIWISLTHISPVSHFYTP